MAEPAGDYHRGEMDIHEQASTYSAFLSLSKWGSLVLAAGLLFFVILFCTEAGFMAAGIAMVVLLVAGFALLRSKPGAAGH